LYHANAWIGLIKEGLTQSPCQIHGYWKQMVALVRESFLIL
ncbi:TPA: dihydroxyacetone kinase transcriptional activator DhaS, partial [Streptococcus suis]